MIDQGFGDLASDSKIEEFTAWPRQNLSHGLLGASKDDDKTCQQKKQRMISSHSNPWFREIVYI
jgi:hypothetical protein